MIGRVTTLLEEGLVLIVVASHGASSTEANTRLVPRQGCASIGNVLPISFGSMQLAVASFAESLVISLGRDFLSFFELSPARLASLHWSVGSPHRPRNVLETPSLVPGLSVAGVDVSINVNVTLYLTL